MLITGHAHGVVVLVDKLVIPFSSLSIQRIPLEAHHFVPFLFERKVEPPSELFWLHFQEVGKRETVNC